MKKANHSGWFFSSRNRMLSPLAVCLGALLLAGSLSTACAQVVRYPTRPVRIIVSFPPAGAIDLVTRLVGDRLTERWEQQVVIDNRPGANGIIASELLVRSPRDGYTLLAVSSAHVINPLLLPTSFDVFKDFAPLGTSAKSELMLVAHPAVPAATVKELIALAKEKPGQLTYASAGSGNVNHLAAELFNMAAGVKTMHVPYKGTGPSLAALVGGEVQLTFSPPIAVLAQIKSGKLKAMAVSGASRLAMLPQIPTFDEVGIRDLELRYWFGFLAPAGTPGAIVQKISSEIANIVAAPKFAETVASQGMDPFVSTPIEFSRLLKTDFGRYARVVKSANIKLDPT
jgi:tripartite-type tricarboxylate transporter receptor subunit TctC